MHEGLSVMHHGFNHDSYDFNHDPCPNAMTSLCEHDDIVHVMQT